MGATETLAATAWTGIAYALVGGMPVMINGGTGPVLAFTAVLYDVSISIGVPFLTFRAWIGLWVCAYMIISAFADLNRFMHLATRFTDEIFSTLISVIFIVNALGSPTSSVGIFHYFNEAHASHEEHTAKVARNESAVPIQWVGGYSHLAAALLSVICCLGTTYLALTLRAVKQSPFFGPRSRAVVADFAVVVAVVTFSLIDRIGFASVRSETLRAPATFAPTFQCCDASCTTSWPDACEGLAEAWGSRAWMVDLTDLNGKGWVPIFAAVPALLAFILLFLDNGITWHLINRPENQLTHGEAMNYDTIVIGVAVLVNSLFGLPWLCAATVRSVNHLQALAEKDDKGVRIVSVQQTRLTHLTIHALVLATLFAMHILKAIPMSVLYGVFLYMGIVALKGNQLFERLTMLAMQPSKFPDQPYVVARLPRRTIFGFTLVQLGLFVLMYLLKTIKATAIAFPLVIAACIPIRLHLLPRLFSPHALALLDGDEGEIRQALGKKDADESWASHGAANGAARGTASLDRTVIEAQAAASQVMACKGMGTDEEASEKAKADEATAAEEGSVQPRRGRSNGEAFPVDCEVKISRAWDS